MDAQEHLDRVFRQTIPLLFTKLVNQFNPRNRNLYVPEDLHCLHDADPLLGLAKIAPVGVLEN